MAALSNLLSFGKDKKLKTYRATVDKINALEPTVQDLSDDELRAKSDELREHATGGESLDKLLPESFALVREASKRVTGMRHFDVQLIGAMALNDGSIAEMKTGEGKTLVSTAAGYLNALGGDNVHVVTVNDYLARRDSEWMGGIYRLLGMEVGLIQNQMQSQKRKPQYLAAVTYGTNSEFGFDYLRDNMVEMPQDRVQRGHSFAIVDEVDSILIDEARTPLIISGLGGRAAATYRTFARIIPKLDPEEDCIIDEKRRTVYATEEGLDKIEEMLGEEIYADISGKLANHLQQALKAEFLFRRDHDYVVEDGEVKIVDEFTGRIMEGRRYSDGLHQAIEAKEDVEIKQESQTLATVTLQNYFRLYRKLSGMTGTALTEDSEFRQIYHMPVIPIPTNKPVVRVDHDDLVYRTLDEKYNAVADEVERRHAKGQPVLVGTASIKGSERISELLSERGIEHELLNAKSHEDEARIVAQAGRQGAITIATNMAGRGTDIQLGGNFDELVREKLKLWRVTPETATPLHWKMAESEARYITDREGYAVRQFGGLCVIGTDRHESRRIDNQLRGRSGRQGDPGESWFYLSLEDDLLRRFGQDRLDVVSDMMKKSDVPEGTPVSGTLVSKVIGTAQRQVESMHFAMRKHVLEYDDVMNLQRLAVYAERDAIIDGKDLDELLPEIIGEMVDDMLAFYCPEEEPSDDWDIEALRSWVVFLTGDESIDLASIEHDDDPAVIGEAIASRLGGIIDERRETVGAKMFKQIEKQIMLRLLDTYWLMHLQDMDRLKMGIGLRALGHRDPLTEYKEEAYEAFSNLVDSVYEELVRMLLRMPIEKAVEKSEPDEESPFASKRLVYTKQGDEGDPGADSPEDRRIL